MFFDEIAVSPARDGLRQEARTELLHEPGSGLVRLDSDTFLEHPKAAALTKDYRLLSLRAFRWTLTLTLPPRLDLVETKPPGVSVSRPGGVVLSKKTLSRVVRGHAGRETSFA